MPGKRIFIDIFHIKIIISLMKTKNIPPDIKSKSINEAKIEILDILKRLEDNGIDLENSKKDYERLLLLNNHVDNIFKEKLTKIHSIGKKK